MPRFRICVAALLALASASVHAQNYPVRPVRMLLPYAPGGPVDIVGRIVAQKLSESFGQQFIVDNRAGAGGNIAVEIVARAAPDGYTLLMGANGVIAINPSLYQRLPADPERDLAPVSMVASSAMVLVVHPSLPATSARQLIALAKANPGAITYASAGNGSTAHLAAELFISLSGTSMVHVPYKGAGPAVADLIGGQVQTMITAISSTLPHVRSGRLRALAVSSLARQPVLPDIPTVAEDLPGYEVITWYGLFAPAATPWSIVNRLSETLARIFATPDAQSRIAAVGADVMTKPPREFAAQVRQERVKWAKIVKESGARAQ